MRVPTIRNPGVRILAASCIAAGVGLAPVIVIGILRSLLPSERPFDIGDIAVEILISPVFGLLLTILFLPVCGIASWILRRRRVRSRWAWIAAGFMVAGGALGASACPRWILTAPLPLDVDVMIAVTGYCLGWPIGFGLMSPHPADASSIVPIPAAFIRARDTAFETLAIIAALALPSLVSMLGTVLLMIGGASQPDWSVHSSSTSPDGAYRAFVAENSKTGAIGHVEERCVFVLPSSQTWSPRHRGLLMWQCDDVDSVRVSWESDRALRVDTSQAIGRRPMIQSFRRNGFRASTGSKR